MMQAWCCIYMGMHACAPCKVCRMPCHSAHTLPAPACALSTRTLQPRLHQVSTMHLAAPHHTMVPQPFVARTCTPAAEHKQHAPAHSSHNPAVGSTGAAATAAGQPSHKHPASGPAALYWAGRASGVYRPDPRQEVCVALLQVGAWIGVRGRGLFVVLVVLLVVQAAPCVLVVLAQLFACLRMCLRAGG